MSRSRMSPRCRSALLLWLVTLGVTWNPNRTTGWAWQATSFLNSQLHRRVSVRSSASPVRMFLDSSHPQSSSSSWGVASPLRYSQEARSYHRDNNPIPSSSWNRVNPSTWKEPQRIHVLPMWFPWIPSKQQIQSLQSLELEEACLQRGLNHTGTSRELQQRMLDWTRQQQPPKLKANSLAEWARTVDLKPLLQRRAEIINGTQDDSTTDTTTTPTTEYMDKLSRLLVQDGDSNNFEVKHLYEAVQKYDKAGDLEMTESLLLYLLETTPRDGRVYRRLARLYQQQGKPSTARAVLQRGIRRLPDNAYLWHGLAMQLSTTHMAQAELCFQKAIRIHPQLPHSYHAYGLLEHSRGHIAKAMNILKTGVERCPTSHRLHHALGDLYREAKLNDLAIRSYQKAIQHGHLVSHGFAYTSLARVYYEMEEFEKCRRMFQKAVERPAGWKQKEDAKGWVAWAQMEESLGNVERAREICSQAAALYERGLRQRKNRSSHRSGDRFQLLYENWARLETRYGTDETVDQVYAQATAAFPKSHKLWVEWAKYHAGVTHIDRARSLYARACSVAARFGRSADPFRLFGEFELALGNYEQARRILFEGAKALSKLSDGNHSCGMAELYHRWAVSEWYLGNLDRAQRLLQDAMRLTNDGSDNSGGGTEYASKLRSYILFTMARLSVGRQEYHLAQHWIGLCLKENTLPGGNSQVWDLWADIAESMGNEKLALGCRAEAAKQPQENGPSSNVSRLLSARKSTEAAVSLDSTTTPSGPDMKQLMRRDPWYLVVFGSPKETPLFFSTVRLPLLQSEKR